MHRNNFDYSQSFKAHSAASETAEALREQRQAKRKLGREQNTRQWEQRILSFLAREAAKDHFCIVRCARPVLPGFLNLSPRTLQKYLKGLITKGHIAYLQDPERYGLPQPSSGARYLVCREMNLKPDPFESEQSTPAAVSNRSQMMR